MQKKEKGKEMACHLTPKQLEVLHCLSQGMQNKQIASEMGVSLSTVKIHLNRIYMRLHVSNRLQALLWMNDNDLV